MNPVIVRNVKIGEGIPKICVPVVGTTEKEILTQAEELSGLPVDIVEWRADWFADVFDFGKVKKGCRRSAASIYIPHGYGRRREGCRSRGLHRTSDPGGPDRAD